MHSALKIASLVGAAAVAFASSETQRASANQLSYATSGITASCPTPNRDAAVLHASPADVPNIPGLEDAWGTAYLQVDLTSTGRLMRSSIVHSTGNRILDLAALRAARWTSFQPEIRNCSAVAGSYLFVVSFDR